MASCSYCGSETSFRRDNVPICVRCYVRNRSRPEDRREPPTVTQLHDIALLKEAIKADCSELCTLVLEAYGEWDARSLRAEEIADAVKRFEWAVERATGSAQASSAKP